MIMMKKNNDDFWPETRIAACSYIEPQLPPIVSFDKKKLAKRFWPWALDFFDEVEGKMKKKDLKQFIVNNAHIVAEVVRRPYCCVVLSCYVHGTEFFGAGFSKVSAPDEWDESRGRQIAKGRAVKKIVDNVIAQKEHRPMEAAGWFFIEWRK